MRVTERIALVDKIARELQSRYDFRDVDIFLNAFRLSSPEGAYNSKYVYGKDAMLPATDAQIAAMAVELGIDSQTVRIEQTQQPRYWQKTGAFKLFISHISQDKDKATRLKDTLRPHAISAFVAHEDIHPTAEWQSEIERALYSMDAFLAMHTEGFLKSFWTQQEIGFAVARRIKIISFKMDEDPTGFISKNQALPRRNRTAEEIAAEIEAVLAADPITAERLKTARAAILDADDDHIPF